MPFCCNNCGNRCCQPRRNGPPIRYVVGPMGPMGPAGPQGPRGTTGETGAQGAAGLSNALTAQAFDSTVASGGTAPLAFYASTPNTDITVSNSAVTVASGTYLLSYGFGFTGPADVTSVEVSLYANGVLVPNSGISVYSTAAAKSGVSKSVVITFNAQTPLTLVNTGTAGATYDYAYITAVKLA